MGSESVDDSDDEESDEDSPVVSYSKVFQDNCAFYLAIGMTYEQYWDGDCTLVKDYRKAFEIRQEFRDQEMWIQGMYIYEALCDASPLFRALSKTSRPKPYPKEPYSANKKVMQKRKTKAEDSYRKLANKFTSIAASINKQRHKGEDTIARSD